MENFGASSPSVLTKACLKVSERTTEKLLQNSLLGAVSRHPWSLTRLFELLVENFVYFCRHEICLVSFDVLFVLNVKSDQRARNLLPTVAHAMFYLWNLCFLLHFSLRRFSNEAKVSQWHFWSFSYGFSLSLMERKWNELCPILLSSPKGIFQEKRNEIAIMQIAALSKHH